MSSGLVKVLVRKGGDAETAWCVRVKRNGRTLYRLANILFVHATPAWGDLIEAKPSEAEGGRLTFTKIVEKSGRRTMIVDYEKEKTFRALSKFLEKSFDVVTEGLFGPKDGRLGRAYLAVPSDIMPAELFEVAYEKFPDLVAVFPEVEVKRRRTPKRPKRKNPPPVDLHTFAAKGDLRRVRTHIEVGEKIDARDVHGRTPLFMAVLEGHYDVVRYLIAEGADANAKTERGSTPLVAAAMRGRTEEAKLLLEVGARTDIAEGIDSVLAQAAYRGSTGVVRALLEHDPDLDKRWALREAAAEGYLPIVRLLVAAGADPSWRPTKNGDDALALARKRKHREVIDFLTRLRDRDSKPTLH